MQAAPAAPPQPPIRPAVMGWLFGATVLTGHLFLLAYPTIPAALGLVMTEQRFLDSHAILAAGDAVRAGLNPWKPNPLDALGRPHCYSSWWLVTAELGLTRADNVWVGPLWVTAFLLCALVLLQPRSPRNMLIAAVVLFSPPVMLGVNRANNDLPVFALLAAGILSLAAFRRAGIWCLSTSVVLATGLKFYPLAATAGLLALRPKGRVWLVMALTLGVAAAALPHTEIGRAVGAAPAPLGILTFGHATLLELAGCSGGMARIIAPGVIAGLASLVIARGWAPRFPDLNAAEPKEVGFLTGAAVLVACFLLTGNYAYRLVFATMTVPHLASATSGRGGRLTLVLLLALLWLDGLFCLLSAPLNDSFNPGSRLSVEIGWLLISQPVAWIVVALLAAGLIEAGRGFLGYGGTQT